MRGAGRQPGPPFPPPGAGPGVQPSLSELKPTRRRPLAVGGTLCSEAPSPDRPEPVGAPRPALPPPSPTSLQAPGCPACGPAPPASDGQDGPAHGLARWFCPRRGDARPGARRGPVPVGAGGGRCRRAPVGWCPQKFLAGACAHTEVETDHKEPRGKWERSLGSGRAAVDSKHC